MILFWVCSPSHHHCQGFLSLPNLFHVLPNGWESSSCGCPGLPRNDQFPRSCPNTNTSHPSSAGSGGGQVAPNPPHQSDQEGPTITPRPQQQPLEWPQKEATPAASAKIDSLSGSWQIKGFSSGTRSMLRQEAAPTSRGWTWHTGATLDTNLFLTPLQIYSLPTLYPQRREGWRAMIAGWCRFHCQQREGGPSCCLFGFGQSLINCSSSDPPRIRLFISIKSQSVEIRRCNIGWSSHLVF